MKDCIRKTAMTTADADEYFRGRIEGGFFLDDTSTLAALRVFLDHRMPEDAKLYLEFWIMHSAPEEATKWIINRIHRDRLYIINVTGSQEVIEDTFNSLSATMYQYSGHRPLKSFTDFLSKSAKGKTIDCCCLVNEENHSTILCVANLTYGKLHFINGVLLALFPWYYKAGDKRTEEEQAIIKACSSADKDGFLKALETAAAKYDFATNKIVKLLSGFQSKFEQEALNQKKMALKDVQDNMDEIESTFRDLLQKQRQLQIEITGLNERVKKAEANPEILNLFLNNRDKLVLESANGPYFIFVVKDYLQIWDETEAESIIENTTSDAYEHGGTVENDQKLLRAVFIDQTIKLRVCAAFELGLNSHISAIDSFSFANYPGYMPNPHHQYYGCIGGYTQTIMDALRHGDYVGAIVQAMASAKSLNFGDSAVMSRFYRDVFTDNVRAFELPDGSVVTTSEAIEWLNKEGSQ